MVRSHYDPPDLNQSTEKISAFFSSQAPAVGAGELDGRIEAVSGLVKADFDKEPSSNKRGTLKLPSKSN